ncbi:MAG: tetrahydromethanopterin S-methyltransferase subunit A [Candidatus Altiarchaeota archaeon]|nr:tetrahydromethanopterin S-methyltransferase subunit A [Candidatus Altiarchaeota archaeon]
MVELYPWGGKFMQVNPNAPTAVVTLSEDFEVESDKIALYGNMKTENLGVEKVVANVVSNPNIRFLIVCGSEVRGHRSGDSILNLHRNGVDSNRKVIGARSAIPYIENLPSEAIERFQKQVEAVDLVGETDLNKIKEKIDECSSRSPGSFGEPMFVEHVSKENMQVVLNSDYSLHSSINFDPYGIISQLEG